MPTILGANTLSSGFEVANSLRFNEGDSASLNKTGTSGDRRTWTWSCWLKRCTLGSGNSHLIFGASSDDFSTDYFDISMTGDNVINIQDYQGSEALRYKTNRTFTDVAAWYHIVVRVDTTQSTASNRLRLYINGVEETSFSTETDPSQNTQLLVNKNVVHRIGGRTGDYSDLYLAECVLVDGSSLAPTSFGEFDEDTPTVWKPIDVSGLTFGNNGFYLDFEDSSNLGNDKNGGTDFTANNLTATDQTTDTCTNNFITLNPIVQNTNRTSGQTTSEGNTISIPNSHDSYQTIASTIGLQGAGKWYWEAQVVWNGTASNAYYPRTLGFVTEDYAYSASYLNQDEESWAIIYQAGGGPGWRFGHANSESNISGATSMANGDIMMMALDLDNGKFYAGRNGTFFTSGDPTSGSTGTGALATLDANDLKKFIFPAVTNASNATYYKFNFGNAPFSISSGNSDTNGFGNFEYSVPSGYYAICTKNLGEVG